MQSLVNPRLCAIGRKNDNTGNNTNVKIMLVPLTWEQRAYV